MQTVPITTEVVSSNTTQILDYVKSPVEGEYTTPNTKKRFRSSTSTPGSTDKQQSKIPKPF
jgi:hypothetical protein